MRILLAASAASTNTRSFVESLVARNLDLHVATLHPGEIAGATVHALGTLVPGTGRLGYLRAVPRFRRLHAMLRPDITIGYYASSYGLLATSVARPRVVVTAGSDVIRGAFGTFVSKWITPRLARTALRRADLVLCWADHLARAVREAGVSEQRILTVPRGVDTRRFCPAGPQFPGAAGRIVSTRGLEPFYRPALLLDAMAILVQRTPEAQLRLVGDGPSARELAQSAARMGLDQVVFPGRLPPERIAEVLRDSRVYVSLPPSDGVSASLLEAMGCGLVPVVTDIPANRPWVRHGENGLLVGEPPTPADAASALERALTDGALAERARKQNPPIVMERASREKNARVFEEAFRSLCRSA